MAGVQFTGLASGLDTDSIVKAMLTTQKSKIDNAKNEQTKLTWKKEQWNTVNNLINKFQTNYIDKLRLSSTFESYSATVSSWAVDVKITGNMPIGTHKISNIKLATTAQQQAGEMDKSIFGQDKINVGGTEVSVSKNTSLKDLGLLKDGESTTLEVNGRNKDGTPASGGTLVEITPEDTLSTIEAKLRNADPSLNVNFDLKNERLFISSKETGTESKIDIQIKSDTTKLADKLGIKDVNSRGEGAKYEYNGIPMEADSNDIEINGMSLTLRESTTDEVTIEVKNDPDKIVNFVSEFVDAYNELIEELNKMYYATKVSTSPLTDAEKEGMTDKQIDEYEKNIKDSLLRRDPSLKTVIDTLRGTMQGVVEGNKYGALSAVGITTGNYTENGKLYLDKDKLTKALNDDPDAVKELFTSRGTTENGETVTKTVGIGGRLNTDIQNLSKRVEGIKSYKSYYNDRVIQDNIRNMTSKISELQEKYTKMEKIYYKKFTAMEKALASMNSQSASFLGMLG